MKKLSNKLSIKESGFILPLVIVIGLIIGVGLMALSARTLAGLMRSIRQGQNQQAREAAESGLAILLKELNTNYPYLLINDCTIDGSDGAVFCPGWSSDTAAGGTFRYITSVCPTTTTPPQTLFSKLQAVLPGGISSYKLISYNYTGDQHQGGTATIRVEGKSLHANSSNLSTKAEAFIEQEVNITPKPCSGAQGGYPGLLGETVNLANQDVEGDINGNVVCTTCNPNQSQTDLETDISLKRQGVVQGEIFGGQLALDDPPTFPGFPADYATTYETEPCSNISCDIRASFTLIAGESNGGRCVVDTSKNITHCKVDNILLNGGDVLTINTSGSGEPDASIRLYVNQNIETGGRTGIEYTGDSANFSIFGEPRSESTTCTQNVLIGGTSQSLNAFIYMPDACAGINGGGNADPNILGSMWVREYGKSETFNASSSNAGNIRVPDDMGSKVCAKFGINFCVGIREYAARGSNRWTLLTKP